LAAADGEIVNLFTTGLTDLETDAVATSLTALQRFYDTEQVTYASVFLRSEPTPGQLAEAAHRLGDKLAAAGLSIEVHPWNDPELAPAYVGGMQFLRILGIVALAIMALLVALTLINNVALSVAERAREIGALRAMGFTTRQALGLQLRELVLLVVLAQLAGLGLTALVSGAVRVFPVDFHVPGLWGTILLRIEPSPVAVAASMAVLFVVALTACYVAARLQLERRPIALLQSG
jgi:putative ABC transport system permease protein